MNCKTCKKVFEPKKSYHRLCSECSLQRFGTRQERRVYVPDSDALPYVIPNFDVEVYPNDLFDHGMDEPQECD